MNAGTTSSGRASMGSWLRYGLGSEADDLRGFVVLTSFAGRSPQPISSRMWGSGFLPGKFQGIRFNSTGSAVEYLDRPAGVSRQQQRDVIDAVARLNRLQDKTAGDTEIETRRSQHELAFRLPTNRPHLMD